MGRDRLPPKHRLFVREYLKDRNAARAYRAAGYPGKGAEVSACRLLKDANVAAAVEKGLAKLEAKLDISVERTIKRIAEIAYGQGKIAHRDTLKACELLGKHFGAFREVHEVTGKDGGPQVILTMPANGREAPDEQVIEPDPDDSE